MTDIKSISTDTTRTRKTAAEILGILHEMLVTRLEEDLDLNDPDDLDVYNKSKALQEYIEQTLKEAEDEQRRTQGIQPSSQR